MDLSQPNPIPTENKPLWESVIEKMSQTGLFMSAEVVADMRRRDEVGRQTYGVPLTAGNGRDALKDAYAEMLDASVYLEQYLVEWGDPVAKYWQEDIMNMLLVMRQRLEAQEIRRARSNANCPNSP